MTEDDLGLLLVRFADHALSESEVAVLERELESNPAARAQLWRMAEIAIATGDAGLRHAGPGRTSDVSASPLEQRRRRRAPWAIAIAAAGVFFAAVLFFATEGGSVFGLQPSKAPPSSWELDLSTSPERLTGDWYPATERDPARISAAPALEQKENGTAFAHQCVILRSPSKHAEDAFAAVGPDSVLRLKLRLKVAFPLQLMISTRRPDGSFGGNFELTKKYPELGAGADWHTLEVPFAGFKALHPDLGKSASGSDISVIIISTLHEPVGLEVSGISILPHPTEEREKR